MKQESIESNVSHMKTCSNSEHADNEDVLNVYDKQGTIKSDNAESKAYFTFKGSHNEINNAISTFPENDFRYNTLHEIEAANSVSENPKQTSKFSSWRKNTSFIVPAKFWDEFWTNGKKMKRGWFNEFCKIFSTTYLYCVLTYQWHKCSLQCKGGKSFQALAKCKHTSFTQYKFIVNEVIAYPHTEYSLLVFIEGNCDHSSHENHRRFVQGSARKLYAEELKSYHPQH